MNPLLALCITAIVALVVFRSVHRVLDNSADDATAAPFTPLYPQIRRAPITRQPAHPGADDARIRAELATLADYLADRQAAR